MKKLIYLLLTATLTTATLSSCTEEEVKPQAEVGTGTGGSPIRE
jgi:hypothetical protein